MAADIDASLNFSLVALDMVGLGIGFRTCVSEYMLRMRSTNSFLVGGGGGKSASPGAGGACVVAVSGSVRVPGLPLSWTGIVPSTVAAFKVCGVEFGKSGVGVCRLRRGRVACVCLVALPGATGLTRFPAWDPPLGDSYGPHHCSAPDYVVLGVVATAP